MTILFPMTTTSQTPLTWSSTRPDLLFKKRYRPDVRAQNPHLKKGCTEEQRILSEMWQQADPATRERYRAESVWLRFCGNLHAPPRTLAQRPPSERPTFHAPDHSWTLQELRDFYCVLIGISRGRRRAPAEHTRLGKNKTEFLATIYRLSSELSCENTTCQKLTDLYCLATRQPQYIGQKHLPNHNTVLGKHKSEMLATLCNLLSVPLPITPSTASNYVVDAVELTSQHAILDGLQSDAL